MKITTADCLDAIDKFLPNFKHAFSDLRKQKWKRDVKVKNSKGQWVRYFSAFEDRTPQHGNVETWIKVTEINSDTDNEIQLEVSQLDDLDRAFLNSKYPWIK